MRNKAQRRNRPRRLDYTVDLPFAVSVHQLQPQHRTFYQLDPTTGTWEQL